MFAEAFCAKTGFRYITETETQQRHEGRNNIYDNYGIFQPQLRYLQSSRLNYWTIMCNLNFLNKGLKDSSNKLFMNEHEWTTCCLLMHTVFVRHENKN